MPDSGGNPRRYFRLTRADRREVERGLDRNESARSMARKLGRSQSTVAEEVKRNRTVSRGPGKGERAGEPPEGACVRLLSWPWVCNGCNKRRCGCSRPWRCEYSAPLADALASELLSSARVGVDRSEEEFEYMVSCIRSDLSRGLSPEQIATARSAEFKVSHSTIYRWIDKGVAGMSNMELRRKVGYKPRKKKAAGKQTPHGPERSYDAFCALPEEQRARACEMDTVEGAKGDEACALTLFSRACKLQLCPWIASQTEEAVAGELDAIERALGSREAFEAAFGLVLTDNGSEFADPELIERSVFGGKRCDVYYCDPRQSQQKGGCERNHVELRKLIPKGKGVSFDLLAPEDLSEAMSQLNSEPRPSLMGLAPIAVARLALGEAAVSSLMGALGMREVPYAELDLTPRAIDLVRARRGEPPMVP